MKRPFQFVMDMLFPLLVVSALFSHPSSAQIDDFVLASDNLVVALDVLSEEVNQTREKVNEYLPEIVSIGNELAASINDIANLAEEEIPRAQDSLETLAHALDTIAKVLSNLKKSKIEIAVMATVVITGSIVFAHLLNRHVFTLNKKRSVIYGIYSASRWMLGKCI